MNPITVEIRDTDDSILDSGTFPSAEEADAAVARVLAWYPDAKVTRTDEAGEAVA